MAGHGVARRGRLDPLVARSRRLVEPYLAEGTHHGAGRLVVGVSGGADSLAMAAAVAFHVNRGTRARAVIVDHQLQDDSGEVCRRAAEQCAELGLPAQVVAVDVAGPGGPESAARQARLQALCAASGASTVGGQVLSGGSVLLAHTLDDQAETVLLGLGRGSGARSLRAMAVVTPMSGARLVRPFLGLRRTETERLCELQNLSWWTDPHNADSAYRRVRVRRELLPLMDDVLGGQVAEALARTASLLREDDEALATWADELGASPTVGELARVPTAIRKRALRRMAVDAGATAGELTAEHVAQLERLVMQTPPPGRIELPGHISAALVGNRLTFWVTAVGP